MTFGAQYPRTWAWAALLAVVPALWSTDSRAGQHGVQVVTPVYYQAPAVTYYQAPAVTYYQAPAVTYYQTPASTTAQAPAPTAAQAAVGMVGNAPVYGTRIKATDRNDLIEDLRKEYKDSAAGGAGTSMRERRKTLRDSARTKYAEALGREESELNDAESQDVDLIVSALLDGNGAGHAPVPFGAYPPGYVVPGYAPAYAPAQPLMLVQPVVPVQLFVPVQLLVPVQPKHHLGRN